MRRAASRARRSSFVKGAEDRRTGFAVMGSEFMLRIPPDPSETPTKPGLEYGERTEPVG